MSFGIISFLKSATANRGAVPVADDQPLPVNTNPTDILGVTQTSVNFNSLATTNATSQKAAPGRLMSVTMFNTSAAVKFFKFYDKASAPTVGTDAPVLVVGMASGQTVSLNFAPLGVKFALGIAFATTALATNADATAVAAGDIVGKFDYF